jgi:hypothetical protein
MVVHCKPIGNGNNALKYLAPNIYRLAITNNRIEKLENGEVMFRFKNSNTDQWETATLTVPEFIHRGLQHVMSKGFLKIRYFGFQSPNKRNQLAVAKYLLGASQRSDHTPAVAQQYICPHYGAKLRRVKSLPKLTRAPP